jgi:hypothetical protein
VRPVNKHVAESVVEMPANVRDRVWEGFLKNIRK